MTTRLELFEDEQFLRNLFDALPCGVLVFDQDRRLRHINDVLEKLLDIKNKDAIGKCGGDVLGCIHAVTSKNGCGTTEHCKKCEARKAAIVALSDSKTYKTKAFLQLSLNGRIHDVNLLLTASPFKHNNDMYAVVIIEDISKLDASNYPELSGRLNKIIGQHPTIIELHQLIMEAAQVNFPVLIQGETGTGKELVAKAIHANSSRKNNPFVAVNCAALPHDLLESELFGHVKGSFTGAFRDQKGRFELADGGTIFLDEIGELDPDVQVKLLRVLQEGAFERIGGSNTIKVNVRVISATNKDIQNELSCGGFRLDLFYRLCVVPISVPTLQERRSDIKLLTLHFIATYSKEFGKRKISISPAAFSILNEHSWPGNVRELQNTIQFSLMKCKGTTIEPIHLPKYLTDKNNALPVNNFYKRKLDEKIVAQVLAKTQGNKVKASKELGVARATLYRFIKDKMDDQ